MPHKANSSSFIFSFDSKFITPGGISDAENMLQYGAKLQESVLHITITELPKVKICISRRNKTVSFSSFKIITPFGLRIFITSNPPLCEHDKEFS